MSTFRSSRTQREAARGRTLWLRSALVLLTTASLVAAMFTVATDSAPANAATAGVLTGTVTGAGGAPLEGIDVHLQRSGTSPDFASARTDASGRYSIDISQVEAFDYTLAFTDLTERYATEYWNGAATSSQAQFFRLTRTSEVSPKNAELELSARLSGVVTGSLPSLQVDGVSATLLAAQTGEKVASTTVNGGKFELRSVPAGSYKLYFSPANSSLESVYAGQFWRGASTWATAQTISIDAGSIQAGYDVGLVPGGGLSGTVTAEGTGAPIPSVYVSLTDPQGERIGNTVFTDSNGNYSFSTSLRADAYKVRFFANPTGATASFVTEYWQDALFESQAAPVVIAGTSAVVKDAQLAVGGSISGTVDLSSLAGATVARSATAYSFDAAVGEWLAQNSVQASPDGHYTITGLAPGTYRVGFEAHSSLGSLGRIFSGGAATVADATDVAVVGTTATPNIDMVLELDITRLDGPDRFDASASISKQSFAPGVQVAYVASGLNFPDALSGAPVAAQAGAPILLVQAGEIPASIKAELERLKPDRVVVLGGIDSVSEAVETQLDAYTTGTVTRLAGADRFAASAAISAESFGPGVATAYVANGLNFPDALAGAPAAAKNGSPILLVTPTSIPAEIEDELERLNADRIVVLGGVNSVSEAVKTNLASFTDGTVTRLAGDDRFSASADISSKNFAANAPIVYITNGLNFPDALSGAPVAGREEAPILLVAPNSLPESIADELYRLKPARIVILGGVNSVSPLVAGQLQDFIVIPES
ncbi:carboxypeptidase family protein [Glaciihabitans tibetensis]|uniref:Carboxypeptidase family protein n=1 Tax=Glaciihabitans tibetensis TaxID=1266600 RepID=A0A2T0VFB2_9MICO|nr:cell wall-binding repeat-containing protein [Glaciihabitans tibetensis]PRY68883.1 carboxypeptidase family protein [Glaciihabitans tibetensis]